MSGCNRCGARTNRRLCRHCELDDRYAHAFDEDEDKDDTPAEKTLFECPECNGRYKAEGPGCPHCGYYGGRYAGDDAQESQLVTDGGRSLDDYVDLGEIVEEAANDNDTIDSLDEANEAAIEQDMALRVQPPAPQATLFFFAENGHWKRYVHGHTRATTVGAETVRDSVQNAIPENGRLGGGGVKAVNKAEADR